MTCYENIGFEFLKHLSMSNFKPIDLNCKHHYYVFRFLCKMDYENDKFIHAPTCTYNEVM